VDTIKKIDELPTLIVVIVFFIIGYLVGKINKA